MSDLAMTGIQEQATTLGQNLGNMVKGIIVKTAMQEVEAWLNGDGINQDFNDQAAPLFDLFSEHMQSIGPALPSAEHRGGGRKSKTAALPSFTVEAQANDV